MEMESEDVYRDDTMTSRRSPILQGTNDMRTTFNRSHVSIDRRRDVSPEGQVPERVLETPRRSREISRQCYHIRDRTRSRSRRSSLREREEELEVEKQRLEALQSKLRNERERQESRDRQRYRYLELRERRRSPRRDEYDAQKARYESTSIFFEEFLKMFKNQISERDSFPALNNVLPEFDPMCREQNITIWINKVDECAEIYKWNDKQTIHYALPKLAGHAKVWYQGLPSLKRTWLEWKTLLTESFPATENYAELLTEMLNKRARFGESLEQYYFAKVNLLNRCKIFGKEAIDCILHGIDDRGVRLGAQTAKFTKPEELLQLFKTLKSNLRDTSTDYKNDKRLNNRSNRVNKGNETTNSFRPRQNLRDIVCFNCKEVGHPCSKCPKPIVKCTYCHLIGHSIADCSKRNRKPDSQERKILRVETAECSDCLENLILHGKNLNETILEENVGDKYKIVIKVNGKPITCQVDLGSEATLIRKSDAQKLGLDWSVVDGPLLRGLGGVPFSPLGRTQAVIDVQEIVEDKVEILVVEDNLINSPLLLGHTFTERPSVRIVKTMTELKFERSEHDPSSTRKLMLRTETEVIIGPNEIGAIRVKAEEPLSGNLYIEGSVRGKIGKEHYLLPGEYEIHEGRCLLLIQSLTKDSITFPRNFLITRARYVGLVKHVLNVTADDPNLNNKPIINCGKSLSPEEIKELHNVLETYKTSFSSGLHDLGYTTEAEMVIRLNNNDPVVYRPYRMSHSEREHVKTMIHEMMECGIVRESNSPYASPIVLVKKKSGEKRLCVDYRALNNRTKRDHYPLPRIEDLLDQLSGQTIFTTLDLASGYHQIPIAEESVEKTAFVTPDGQYEYTRMPFGLANAPAVFQRVMHKILDNAKVKYVIVYMDDIVVISITYFM